MINLKKIKEGYTYLSSSLDNKKILDADKLLKLIKQVDELKFLLDK